MAAVLAAPAAGKEAAQAIRETAGLLRKVGDAAARSASLTPENDYRGAKWLGALLAVAYQDFATWWDTGFAPSPVGQLLGIRGHLPRLAPSTDPKTGRVVPVLLTKGGFTQLEANRAVSGVKQLAETLDPALKLVW